MAAPSQELSKQYRPADHEANIFARWQEAGAFHADPGRVLRGEAEPYCVLIPPPNVTDRLHLGHALNNTLQDILVRAHRMMGYEALWMPGTDHAGIATQAVVERRLRKDGVLKGPLKQSMKREDFVAQVQAFKDEYEAVITGQLKAMGCSCDWERQRFTMDPVCARAVREAFFRLFKDGLIYRGKRLVNWDPALQTAVADDEVENIEVDGAFYYLRYPLVHQHGQRTEKEVSRGTPAPDDAVPVSWNELARRGYPGASQHGGEEQAWVTVATTRPETYLGDTAVAVSPKDPRAKALRGLFVELPIVGRVIPVIEDDYVVLPAREGPYGKDLRLPESDEPEDAKAAFATGFLKVTPAHDPNDYELGQRHKLPMINVMAPDASISDKHGWADARETAAAHIFLGKKREEVRKLVVKEFEARGLLEDTKPYRHTVGHSDRSKAAIEPYLSDQWYVRVTDPRMAASANAALAPEHRSGKGQAGEAAWAQGGGTGVPPVTGNTADAPGTSKPGRVNGDPYDRLGPVPGDALRTTHRNLPHFQRGGSMYFVTFRVVAGELSHEERQVVLDACRHWDGQKMELHAAVVMPDHVHLIVSPFFITPGQSHSLSELLHSIKSFTSHEIGKRRGVGGQVWLDESHDRIIRRRGEFSEKLHYLVQNPVRKGLANEWRGYPFLWFPEETRSGCYRFVERVFDKRPGQRIPLPNQGDQGRGPSPGHRRDACATPATSLVFPEEEETQAGDGSLRFHPARYAKTYENWHDNIRDWCISRQLWWGHRIPVWRAEKMGQPVSVPGGVHAFAAIEAAEATFETKAAELEQQGRIWRMRSGRTTESALADLRVGQKIEYSGGFEFCVRNENDREAIAFLESVGLKQDPDVLDTWFSSALWPMSTMGWPDPELAAKETGVADFPALVPAFNPTSTLCTAREIITLWVSRMVMFNRYFMGEGQGKGPLPYKDVYIHCVVQDGQGRKMSKSLGNGVDPLDIIASHGTDAMRFTICQMATQTQDVRLPVKKDSATGKNTSDKFDLGRNFANKVWNAASFALKALGTGHRALGEEGGTSAQSPVPSASLPDRWMLSRLQAAVAEVEGALKNFEFSSYGQTIYDLLWRDFCDWYLEAIKPTVASDPRQRAVLAATLDTILRLLHPVMPFVTEAIYEQLRGINAGAVAGVTLGGPRKGDVLATAAWPRLDESLRDERAEREFESVRSLVSKVREVRAAVSMPPKAQAMIEWPTEVPASFSHGALDLIHNLGGLQRNGVAAVDEPQLARIAFQWEGRELAIHAAWGKADTEGEKARLTKLIADLEKSITTLEARLANPGYALKAPPAMVQQTKDQLEKAKAELAAGRKGLEALGN